MKLLQVLKAFFSEMKLGKKQHDQRRKEAEKKISDGARITKHKIDL